MMRVESLYVSSSTLSSSPIASSKACLARAHASSFRSCTSYWNTCEDARDAAHTHIHSTREGVPGSHAWPRDRKPAHEIGSLAERTEWFSASPRRMGWVGASFSVAFTAAFSYEEAADTEYWSLMSPSANSALYR